MADVVVAETPRVRVRPSRLRGVAAGVLVVLTALAVLVASLAVWADRTVLDRGRFSATVGRVAQDPHVVDAATSFLTDELFTALGPSATATAGTGASSVVGPLLAQAARPRVEEAVRSVLQAPATRVVIETVVGEAHTVALRLVRSGGSVDVADGGVTVDDGVVRLDLVPLVDDALRALQSAGVIPTGITVPDLTPGSPANQRVQQLATSLGVALPPDFAQITVYSSQDLADAGAALARADDALALFQRAVGGIVVVAIALAALAARHLAPPVAHPGPAGRGHRRGHGRVPLARGQVGEALVRQVDDGRARVVVRAAVDAFGAGLRTSTVTLLVIGVVVAVVGILAGRRRAGAGRELGHAGRHRLSVGVDPTAGAGRGASCSAPTSGPDWPTAR